MEGKRKAGKSILIGSWDDLPYLIKWTLLFQLSMVAFAGIIFSFDLTINTGSSIYEDVYFSRYLHSKFFDLSKLLYFLISIPVGFTYINIIYMKRSDPFTSGEGNYNSFRKTFIFGFLLFFLSGNFSFFGKKDQSSKCIDDGNVRYIKEEESLLLSFLFSYNSYFRLDDSNCYTPSTLEIALLNGFSYGFFLILGCNFDLFERIEWMNDFQLDCQHIRKWGFKCWALFTGLISFVLVVSYYYIVEWSATGYTRLYYYAFQIVLMVLYFIIYGSTHQDVHLHIHHYNFVSILMMFNGLHYFISNCFYGFMMGVFIQEVAQMQFWPMWEPNRIRKRIAMRQLSEEL